MEKVKVVKAVPGILNVGDVLVAPEIGADFCIEETTITKQGSSERYVSLDYTTVSENVPTFFEFENEAEEIEELEDLEIELECERTDYEIAERYNHYRNMFELAWPGSEEQVVYQNLMWFIEWLKGKRELI
jgi:hypothetical protein